MSRGNSRIPFSVAISEEAFMRKRFHQSLSVPQRVVLKALYGVPFGSEVDPYGHTEQEIWSRFQGEGTCDALGYPLTVPRELVPAPNREFKECWIIGGRRIGKSEAVVGTSAAYEACLGGHEDWVRVGQPAAIAVICQNLRVARYTMKFILAALREMPIGRELLDEKNITSDEIPLKNGIHVICVPPTKGAIRGFAVPVAILDELGVWYQTAEAANPDYEVYNAISPAQLQFPNKKIIGISSPWNKAGLLWRYSEAGTEGKRLPEGSRGPFKDALVIHSTTAGMANPIVQRKDLQDEYEKDSKNFEREYLARFQDSISGFLPSELVEKAVDRGIEVRPHRNGLLYVAAIDPAFRGDAFSLTIVHNEGGIIIQDVAHQWIPRKGEHLQPEFVVEELAQILRSYHLTFAYSDQWSFDALHALLRQKGLVTIQESFTSASKTSLYGNLQQLFYQRKIRLLDHPVTIQELKSIERTLREGGRVSINAPAGQHDDAATVLALAAAKSMWQEGEETFPVAPKTDDEVIKGWIEEHIAARQIEPEESWWV